MKNLHNLKIINYFLTSFNSKISEPWKLHKCLLSSRDFLKSNLCSADCFNEMYPISMLNFENSRSSMPSCIISYNPKTCEFYLISHMMPFFLEAELQPFF